MSPSNKPKTSRGAALRAQRMSVQDANKAAQKYIPQSVETPLRQEAFFSLDLQTPAEDSLRRVWRAGKRLADEFIPSVPPAPSRAAGV